MTKFTTFTTAKKLAKTLLTSIIMSPITLSTAVITLFSVDNIVAMENSKSIKTDVDLNNGIGKIVSETINNNIKAKAELLKEQNSNGKYWAKQAIESKSKHSSSIYNLKKLFVLAKEHNDEKHEEFNKMFNEAIEALIEKNGNKINSKNEASIFVLLNGLTIYNSLYTIYNSYEYGKGTRSLDKEDLDIFFEKIFYNDVYKGLKDMHINTNNNNLYQILENFIINKYPSGNINFRKVDHFADENKSIVTGFLKHDWDCYLTQFGIINNIKNKKGDVLTESVVKQVKRKEIAPGQIARFVTKQYKKHKKHSAATKINSRFKGYLARKKIGKEFFEISSPQCSKKTDIRHFFSDIINEKPHSKNDFDFESRYGYTDAEIYDRLIDASKTEKATDIERIVNKAFQIWEDFYKGKTENVSKKEFLGEFCFILDKFPKKDCQVFTNDGLDFDYDKYGAILGNLVLYNCNLLRSKDLFSLLKRHAGIKLNDSDKQKSLKKVLQKITYRKLCREDRMYKLMSASVYEIDYIENTDDIKKMKKNIFNYVHTFKSNLFSEVKHVDELHSKALNNCKDLKKIVDTWISICEENEEDLRDRGLGSKKQICTRYYNLVQEFVKIFKFEAMAFQTNKKTSGKLVSVLDIFITYWKKYQAERNGRLPLPSKNHVRLLLAARTFVRLSSIFTQNISDDGIYDYIPKFDEEIENVLSLPLIASKELSFSTWADILIDFRKNWAFSNLDLCTLKSLSLQFVEKANSSMLRFKKQPYKISSDLISATNKLIKIRCDLGTLSGQEIYTAYSALDSVFDCLNLDSDINHLPEFYKVVCQWLAEKNVTEQQIRSYIHSLIKIAKNCNVPLFDIAKVHDILTRFDLEKNKSLYRLISHLNAFTMKQVRQLITEIFENNIQLTDFKMEYYESLKNNKSITSFYDHAVFAIKKILGKA